MPTETDRELLELAAKAAGLSAYWDDEYGRMQMDYHHKGGTNYEEWNPLEDDGDALRLAVKLGMFVDQFPKRQVPAAYAYCNGASDWQDYEGAPHAATRRAIVRAAAELGRKK